MSRSIPAWPLRRISAPSIGSDFAYIGTGAGLNFSVAAVGLGSADRTITLMSAANALSFGGVISGNVGLIANGAGILDLYNSETYTGATTINAGTILNLGSNNGNANAAGALASNSLVLAGGTLNYVRTGVLPTRASPAAPAINSGAANVTESLAATQSLNLGALTRATGGTVNFTITGSTSGTTGIVTSTGNTAGIIGGWATVAGAGWAVGNGPSSLGTLAAGGYTAAVAATTTPGVTGNNEDFQVSNSARLGQFDAQHTAV